MILMLDPLEAVWILLNTAAVLLTGQALLEARVNQKSVHALNGHAREIVADGIVRREFIRLAIQVILLLLVVPGIFSSRPTPLSPFVLALMAIAILLLISSLFDAAERKRLFLTVAKELIKENDSALARLEVALAINTQISQTASDQAERAYHEANDVNNKIAAQGVALISLEQDRADREEESDKARRPPSSTPKQE